MNINKYYDIIEFLNLPHFILKDLLIIGIIYSF